MPADFISFLKFLYVTLFLMILIQPSDSHAALVICWSHLKRRNFPEILPWVYVFDYSYQFFLSLFFAPFLKSKKRFGVLDSLNNTVIPYNYYHIWHQIKSWYTFSLRLRKEAFVLERIVQRNCCFSH